MYCMNCGCNNADTSAFCEQCGSPLSTPSAPAAPQKKLSKAAIAAIISGIAAAAVFALSFVIVNNLKGSDVAPSAQKQLMSKSREPAAVTFTDWSDMKFILGGVEYQLPVKVSEFVDNGWCFGDNIDEIVFAPGERRTAKPDRGSTQVFVEIYNPDTKSEKKVTDCYIGLINFTWADVRLVGGITPLLSTRAEVYKVFDSPIHKETSAYAWRYCPAEYKHTDTFDWDETGAPLVTLRFKVDDDGVERGDDYLVSVEMSNFDENILKKEAKN
ncbi:MAG: zinc ribbon domain-containing protein [Clostridia bacterium]|nr:zinc ribbon domain-containing protein [Clostridia bacterium]